MKPRDLLVALLEKAAAIPTVRKEAGTLGRMEYVVQRRRIFHDCAIDLVVDVGANTGQFARDLRGFYSGDIVSFEPVTKAYAELARAVAADPCWKACQAALGSRDEQRVIHIAKKTVFSSFLSMDAYAQARFGEIAAPHSEETVRVRRLEDALPELVPDYRQRHIFLKMDTQGYDPEVFRGAGSLLEQVQALQSEVSLVPLYRDMPHWTEAIALYEKAGFSVAGMFPGNYDGARVIEFDCLMVRDR